MPYSNGTVGDRGKYSEFGHPVVFEVVGRLGRGKRLVLGL